MKKVLISSIVALALVLGSAGSASAAGYTFSDYLTIGSTGADVSALQQWLIDSSFDIPAISSGAAQKGYFGQQTKAAVVKYQASVGLPSTGFVGPLTVAKLNAGGGSMTVTPPASWSCPAGYTCTANPGTTVPPVT
ncbi:MAG: peptidoglycan-binding domain-containing protein, partial [Patescibacteria group bacterium]